MDGFGVDTMWAAVVIVSLEAMRAGAQLVSPDRRVVRWFRLGAILMAATIPIELAETVLVALRVPQALRVATALCAIAIELCVGGCLVVGIVLLVRGMRPPRGPRRRRTRQRPSSSAFILAWPGRRA